jgi:4-hydroxybutyrate dehydrogenase
MVETMKLPGPDAVGPTIREMSQGLGVPAGLRELGVSESVFPKIIAGVLADHTHKTNPREATVEDYHELLASSM